MALKGDLASVDLAQVFQMLALNKKVGLLSIQSQRTWNVLYFDQRGVTSYYNSHQVLERVVAACTRSGRLDMQVVDETRDHAARVGSGLVECLLAGGLVVGANVFDVVPISETPWLVILGWLSLRLRGLGWTSVGLRRPRSWIITIAVALVAGAALQVLSEFDTDPLIERLTGETPDLSSFRALVGNPKAALGLLALVWTLAAFGEELSYRGYVLERAAALGHQSPVRKPRVSTVADW